MAAQLPQDFSAWQYKCESCGCVINIKWQYCSSCGLEISTEAVCIKYYFKEGYEYEIILSFLAKFHDIRISLRTLKKRLTSLGLRRRCDKNENDNVDEVRLRMQQILDGPGSSRGYRGTWHSLRREGFTVSRSTVATLLKEVDPEGCANRKRHRLTRRIYSSRGPNDTWHMDGYDKLKPFGFPIHGCIDGFSRKILWLFVTRSNNDPEIIANAYLQSVKEHGGCPSGLRSDLGTENGLAAAAHCYFRNDRESHIYGSSHHNQRIEGWWSFLDAI